MTYTEFLRPWLWWTTTRECCAKTGPLLASPDDPVHECDLAQGEAAILKIRIEAFEFDALRRHAAQLLGHHFAGMGFGHHPVAAPQRSQRRHQDAVAVAI